MKIDSIDIYAAEFGYCAAMINELLKLCLAGT